jgi:glutathione S-transferase
MMANAVMSNPSETNQTKRLEIVRVIKASKQRVFDAWTQPQMIRRWAAPWAMVVQEAESEVRVGGSYSRTMFGSPGPGMEDRTAVIQGEYLRVEPYDLLSFTWEANFAPGQHCVVTISLKEVAGGTEMTLVHEGFTEDATREGFTRGWASVLEKLELLLETE